MEILKDNISKTSPAQAGKDFAFTTEDMAKRQTITQAQTTADSGAGGDGNGASDRTPDIHETSPDGKTQGKIKRKIGFTAVAIALAISPIVSTFGFTQVASVAKDKPQEAQDAIHTHASHDLSVFKMHGIAKASGQLSNKSITWGLGHRGNGAPPTPPPGSGELLKKYDGMYLGKTDATKKEIFLTFDLGYEAGHTPAVLDVLKAHNIKGIFFLCGHYLAETELVTRMISEGHTIGNHTNHHKDLPTLDRAGMTKDIADFGTLFYEKFGEAHPDHKLRHFRPGKGRFNETTLQVAKEQNLKTIMWSNAIVDWGKDSIDPVKSSEKLLSRMHDGAIVLLHISNAGMAPTLELLIPKLIEQGYAIGDAGAL